MLSLNRMTEQTTCEDFYDILMFKPRFITVIISRKGKLICQVTSDSSQQLLLVSLWHLTGDNAWTNTEWHRSLALPLWCIQHPLRKASFETNCLHLVGIALPGFKRRLEKKITEINKNIHQTTPSEIEYYECLFRRLNITRTAIGQKWTTLFMRHRDRPLNFVVWLADATETDGAVRILLEK